MVLGVTGSTPSVQHYLFSNGIHFQVTSLLLIMCMLFTIKVISILIKSYLSVTIVLIPGDRVHIKFFKYCAIVYLICLSMFY